ncbi:MAG: ribbon-helix-helix protein, CopG family [Verrucomicrobiae bacterium]|nr:ribbon-helix-helix protein, CopG family [Verrucomicrobiae bacterium]
MNEEMKPISVSLPSSLTEEVDEVVKNSHGFRNRSHFVENAIREKLARDKRATAQGEPLDFA